MCASVPLVWYVTVLLNIAQPMWLLLQSMGVTPPPLYFPLVFYIGIWVCPQDEEDVERSITGTTYLPTSKDVAKSSTGNADL